jgi:acyl carrier protein|tara:strand:+ start:240 stop:479 length:240 start_codon:yes stop_codon:yes gene_type:complete
MTTTAIGVKTRIAEVLNISADRVSEETNLKDLVSDSFLLVEMAIELQEDFRVRFSQEDLKVVHTVQDLIALIEIKLSNK